MRAQPEKIDSGKDRLPTPDLGWVGSGSQLKRNPVDFDNDGYYDAIDSCPNNPETWNKYNDHDGCPDIAPEQSRYKHDADLDGIIDEYDMCPLEAEDYDGDKDFDGCPDN